MRHHTPIFTVNDPFHKETFVKDKDHCVNHKCLGVRNKGHMKISAMSGNRQNQD